MGKGLKVGIGSDGGLYIGSCGGLYPVGCLGMGKGLKVGIGSDGGLYIGSCGGLNEVGGGLNGIGGVTGLLGITGITGVLLPNPTFGKLPTTVIGGRRMGFPDQLPGLAVTVIPGKIIS